ncbi:MAG: hypothetical protein ACTHN0_03740 [Aquihabitans sp.]
MDEPIGAARATELIAIYESEDTAEAVRTRISDQGAEAHVVRPDDPEGAEVIRLALIAEQQEDATDAKSSAQVGSAYPKEAAKGLAITAPILVTGFVIVCVAASLLLLGDLAIGGRIAIGAAVGAVGGFAMSLVIGPAIAAPRPGVPSAAQRGTLVWARTWSSDLEQLMADAAPIRLERRLPDGAFQTVTTEDRSAGRGVVEEIRRNTVDAPPAENDWGQGGPDALPERQERIDGP